jgi:Flp pilus assembly secretin CpaC
MTKSKLLAPVIIALCICSAAVFAQTMPKGDLIPPESTKQETAAVASTQVDEETHPPLNLTPDKSELVRLSRDAVSVVVGNPAHATVLLDTPRLAVIVPRSAGATHFSALDKDGNVIMQRHIIVASPNKNYVRIRRSCGNATQNRDCKPTSVYFCPDMCHEISDEAQAGGRR